MIIENMTNEDYRKAKGISKTGLDLIAKVQRILKDTFQSIARRLILAARFMTLF